jgi:hypothetical protein
MDEQFFAPLELRGEHLCDVSIQAEQGGPGKIESPWGAMMVDYISEGEFAGPRINGQVLPGGGDWPKVSNDGRHSMQIDARAVWQTDDGAKLYVRYEGFLVLPDMAGKGLLDITKVDPAEYYFRTTPIFRTGDERYLWLNESVCVGIGRFSPGGLGYRIFRIA